jgi:hypothetical protein
VQGRDLRDWHTEKSSAAAIATAGRAPARAEIALEVIPRAGAVAVNATARVPGEAQRKGATLFIGLTGDGLASDVKAGENKGKRLVHDHVVRDLSADLPVGAGGQAAGTVVLALPAEAGKAQTIVAFVQNVETGDVLQALALPLSPACLPAR